jgi:hypothetical protein
MPCFTKELLSSAGLYTVATESQSLVRAITHEHKRLVFGKLDRRLSPLDMAWIGKSQGIFRLHDSDSFCGSLIGVEDAAEILDVAPGALSCLPQKLIDGDPYLSELDIHKAWGSGRISCRHNPKCGNATRSFDELVVMKLLEITFTGMRHRFSDFICGSASI